MGGLLQHFLVLIKCIILFIKKNPLCTWIPNEQLIFFDRRGRSDLSE